MQGLIVSGHDISDGGLITTILEMAFAGNCGLNVDVPCSENFSPTVSKAVDVLLQKSLELSWKLKIATLRGSSIPFVRSKFLVT